VAPPSTLSKNSPPTLTSMLPASAFIDVSTSLTWQDGYHFQNFGKVFIPTDM
jgi:predicted acyl esterase